MDGLVFSLRFRRIVLWLLMSVGLLVIVAALALAFGPFALDSFLSSAPPI
jgi:hypothetical protein